MSVRNERVVMAIPIALSTARAVDVALEVVNIHRNSHMTNGRLEVITSVERRRRWSFAEKQQLVATTLEPGASISAVAREAGII